MDEGRLDRPRLEALMERWKIPFRSPSAEIAGVLGMTPDIGGGEDVCALPFPAELSAGSGQLAFVPRYARGGDDRIATFLLRYGRDEGAGRAFDELVEILRRDLGPGRATETSNAAGLEWQRGAAWVKLVRFDVPTGPGAEADAFHARHCLLEIRPGWAPPPSAPETAAFARGRDIAPLTGLAVHDSLGDFSRLPGEPVAADAIRHDAQSATIFVAAVDGSLAILPLERVGKVTLEKFFPAKGDGFVTLRLELRDDAPRPLGLTVLHGPWRAREALAAWAEAFTERTGLPVEVTEDPDA
ncbi:MAG: hypothetical protein ACKO3G_11735 [Planctomycetaceae bacterium]